MKKIFVLIILLLIFPYNVYASKQEDLGKRIAAVAKSAATTYVDDFTYSYFFDGTKENPINRKNVLKNYLQNGYLGIKSSGYRYGFKTSPGKRGSFKNKFATYCETWAALIPYHAKGGGSTTNFYKGIPLKTSNLRPGDKVRYDYPGPHIAIYIDDNNDDNPDTYRIAEAAGYNGGIRVSVEYFSGKGHRGKITGMSRFDEKEANKISYNIINASTDFHDSLDHFPPEVTSVKVLDNKGNISISATDYKKYNGSVKSRDVEPANNGIVGYQVTTSSTEPITGWIKVSPKELLHVETKVKSSGTYYAWVLDVGGNVASKSFTVSKVESSSNNGSNPNNNNNDNDNDNDDIDNGDDNTNNNPNNGNDNYPGNSSGGCNASLQKVIDVTKKVYNILLIIAPIILLVLGSVDLAKAVMAGDEKEIKGAVSLLGKRLLITVAIFLLIYVIRFILSLVPDSGGWLSCW